MTIAEGQIIDQPKQILFHREKKKKKGDGDGYFLITTGINGRKIANQESIDNHTIHNHLTCIMWSYTVAF